MSFPPLPGSEEAVDPLPKIRLPIPLRELRLLEEYLVRHEESQEVPALDRLHHLYLLMWHGEKAVVVRRGSEGPWRIPEATSEDLQDLTTAKPARRGAPEPRLTRWIKDFARTRWGVRVKAWYPQSRLRLTGMDQAESVEPGSTVYQIICCVTAAGLDNVPAEGGWSRRTMTRRDLIVVIREQYSQMNEILEAAYSDYLIRQAKAAPSKG